MGVEYPAAVLRRTPVISDPAHSDLVLVCPNLGDGGAQRVVSTLANAWCREGRRICVVTLYADDEVFELDPEVRRVSLQLLGLRKRIAGGRLQPLLHVLQRSRLLSPIIQILNQYDAWLRVRALRGVIRESRAATVVSFVGSTNLMTIRACRGLGLRLIISERNDPSRQALKQPWDRLRPKLYNLADVVTANSHGALEAMRAYVDEEKLVYVPNPLVIPPISPSDVTLGAPRPPRILIVGRLNPQKAHDVLLRAFASLPAELASWKLAVVGRGELESELRALAQRLGIADRVEWHGQVEDPFAHYRSADIFALPSRHEGTPNALIEAMSCGLPAIVSDGSPGPLELVRDSETGLVVPVDDSVALATALECVANDPGLRKRLGEAGRLEVRRFELPLTLAAWDEIIAP